ncbi:HNH endonuclease [Pseudomonas sp. GD03842]|uniref:HNH endonuclease n=1 Tax=Pseudomonas sp. GD03842 TaxID=2975385 RepID=UPI0024481A0D|nr:HNH endonuclease [Pseudomonas sp. GD03842]MDH0745241.1 HNH endonuclease [Pseudomonas sp. GD03842]
MRLKKHEREQVRLKYGGHCAYCGVELGPKWHADHLQSVRRGTSHRWEGNAERPQNHNLDNMMPACAPCNLSKSQMPLEAWREFLVGHVNSLNLYHPIYRLAKAYGLIAETAAPVVFYFEKVTNDQH